MKCCAKCGVLKQSADWPRYLDGRMKGHCGCRTGVPPRLGTSKYGMAGGTKSAEFKRMAAIMALPGYKPVRHDAHVKLWRATRQAIDHTKHSAHVSAWRKARPGDYFRNRYRSDPEFNAKQKMRARVRRASEGDSEVARLLANYAKQDKWKAGWSSVLGYELHELTAHLRRVVPKGWKWQDFLAGELHIDHILPRSGFDCRAVSGMRACWALSNLQLLPSKLNLKKGARAQTLL